MRARGWLLPIGILVASVALMACTPPPGFIFPHGDEPGEGTETATPTETVEPTETEEATATPEVTATAEATDESARAGCPGNPGGTPPVAATIAATYSVSEDEVMGWFCKGFGFGEIKKAYQWAGETGKSVYELFALRQQGLGWGEIAQGLDIKPGNQPCWAGPDHGASDPDCVKPGNGKSGDHGGGQGKNGQGGNGKNGKP